MTQYRAFQPGDRDELFASESLFLSASVPYRRPGTLSAAARKLNEHYVETSRPHRIRAAVTELCRSAFSRDLNLIFGGHPAISPMVLTAARRFVSAAKRRKRVLIFQSLFFRDKIPEESLELGDWQSGELLWTAAKPDRNQSLTWMREVMVRCPKLLGAVFIGGMDGVEEEASLFRKHNPGRPLFAVGSAGAAASDLLDKGQRYAGTVCGPDVLATDLSYPRVFGLMFSDLGRP